MARKACQELAVGEPDVGPLDWPADDHLLDRSAGRLGRKPELLELGARSGVEPLHRQSGARVAESLQRGHLRRGQLGIAHASSTAANIAGDTWDARR